MSTYTTTQGDTWDLIAYKLFGAERHMKDLLEANMPLADILVFPGGMEITVPEVKASASSSLPFWHNGDNSIWQQE